MVHIYKHNVHRSTTEVSFSDPYRVWRQYLWTRWTTLKRRTRKYFFRYTDFCGKDTTTLLYCDISEDTILSNWSIVLPLTAKSESRRQHNFQDIRQFSFQLHFSMYSSSINDLFYYRSHWPKYGQNDDEAVRAITPALKANCSSF